MPPSDEIQRNIVAAWRIMMGRYELVRAYDVSADGFWNSFFAIVLCLPVLLTNWVPLANEMASPVSSFGERLSIVLRLAIVDLATWVLPLAVLALLAGLIDVRDRFVHYVVVTNWGSVILVWMLLPANLVRLVWPGEVELVMLLSLVIFLATLVLLWRLTNAAIDKGPMVASTVFATMLMTSFFILFTLQALFGVTLVE